MFDFKNEIPMGMTQIDTIYKNKSLVLLDIYKYSGPLTLQYLPYGGIQSVYGGQIIVHTKSGYIASRNVIYDGKLMSSQDFIALNPNLVNYILGE